ncbi:DnaD and phage-associated domain-containing protein [Acidaminobacter hydrogenoformans DSM 2784]|uniref:DnaD and phage-associated domain-containing protein n=2 Tax=Acidaminobacter TaxID=65402 RepID=A0A1G5RR79_9FIRM|nr:DnaD and phage-associated domain-containing protein [Acidaminobacter hydrogenoformans DSM 2784]
MGFHLQEEKVDFGTTSIENIFINDFMPMANGTYVKVYLLGYKMARDSNFSITADNNTISRHLNLPLEDVMAAWDFWEKKKIVVKHPNKETMTNPNHYDIEFLSLRQLYLDNNYAPKNLEPEHLKPSTGDLIDSMKNAEIRDMFYNIDQIMRRQLTPNERTEILSWVFEFNLAPELIIKAFLYSVEQKNVKNVNYVGAVLRGWYDQGILSPEEAEEYMKSSGKAYAAYRKIYRVLGYSNRTVSSGDREIIDRWIDRDQLELDFLCEVIKEATKRTANANMNYMDTVVKNLIENKIDTIEKYKTYMAERASAKASVPEAQSTAKGKAPGKAGSKNRFHEFEPKGEDYSPEDLERLLRSKK